MDAQIYLIVFHCIFNKIRFLLYIVENTGDSIIDVYCLTTSFEILSFALLRIKDNDITKSENYHVT